MIRGLYNAASSLITRQVQQENLSNNISNINTPGFKKSNVLIKSFNDTLIQCRESYSGEKNKSKTIGSINYGVGIDGIKTDYSQGIMKSTDRKSDFAIDDDRFMFNVQDSSGNVHLTRDGRFQVSDGGYIVDAQGRRVLGSNGNPIIISSNEPIINKDGILENSTGRVGFMLTEINTQNGDPIRQSRDLSPVKQGYLEGSNVNVAEVMTEMITISRNYESSQKIFQQMDEILGKAVNEVGVVR